MTSSDVCAAASTAPPSDRIATSSLLKSRRPLERFSEPSKSRDCSKMTMSESCGLWDGASVISALSLIVSAWMLADGATSLSESGAFRCNGRLIGRSLTISSAERSKPNHLTI